MNFSGSFPCCLLAQQQVLGFPRLWMFSLCMFPNSKTTQLLEERQSSWGWGLALNNAVEWTRILNRCIPILSSPCLTVCLGLSPSSPWSLLLGLWVKTVVFWDVDNVRGPLKDGKDVKVHLVSPTCLKDGKTKARVGRRLGWARDALLADIGLEPRSLVYRLASLLLAKA